MSGGRTSGAPPPRGEPGNQILDQPGLLGLPLGGSRTTAALLPYLSDGTSHSTAGTGIRFWAGVVTSAPRPPLGPGTVAAVPLGRCRRKRRLVWTSRRGGDERFLPRGPAASPSQPVRLAEGSKTRRATGTRSTKKTKGTKGTRGTRRRKRTKGARRTRKTNRTT